MAYKLPKCIGFITSFITCIVSGGLLIKEKDNISFNQLTKDEKIFGGLLIFSEIFLLTLVSYFVLSCIWSGLVLCCNDRDNTVYQFSIYKILYLLGGIGAHIYLFITLLSNYIMINNDITISSWFLVGNLLFVFTVTTLNKIYNLCCIKHNKDYDKF